MSISCLASASPCITFEQATEALEYRNWDALANFVEDLTITTSEQWVRLQDMKNSLDTACDELLNGADDDGWTCFEMKRCCFQIALNVHKITIRLAEKMTVKASMKHYNMAYIYGRLFEIENRDSEGLPTCISYLIEANKSIEIALSHLEMDLSGIGVQVLGDIRRENVEQIRVVSDRANVIALNLLAPILNPKRFAGESCYLANLPKDVIENIFSNIDTFQSVMDHERWIRVVGSSIQICTGSESKQKRSRS